MDRTLIVDASPLIVLIKSDLVYLLPRLFENVIIPAAVYSEILAGRLDDRARTETPGLRWMEHANPIEIDAKLRLFDLGDGESETISLGLANSNSIVLIDDAAARKCAKELGLSYLGTGGLLLRAKRNGQIDSLKGAIDKVRASGLWISQEVVDLLLKKANE